MYKFLLISGHCKDISAKVGPAWSFCFTEYTKTTLKKFEYCKIPKYVFLLSIALKNIHFKRSFYSRFSNTRGSCNKMSKIWQNLALLFFLLYFQIFCLLISYAPFVFSLNYWQKIFIDMSYNIALTHWLCILQINYRELFIFTFCRRDLFYYLLYHNTTDIL